MEPTEDQNEKIWIAREREKVVTYLTSRGLPIQGLADQPVFYSDPNFALWVVESQIRSDCVDYWVVSGRVGIDHIDCVPATDPRDALRYFSDRWTEIASASDVEASRLKASSPSFSIVDCDPERLKREAGQIREWAEDQSLWI